jgi:hypothetical protein
MKRAKSWVAPAVVLVSALGLPCRLWGATSQAARASLSKLLLGKDVKPLIELPASKGGLSVYLAPPKGKRTDERGIDLGSMTKHLKSKGVGVEAEELETISRLKIEKHVVSVYLGTGGEEHRWSNPSSQSSPGYKRAGSSRVTFRFGREISDRDIDPEVFLNFMSRVLDVSAIQAESEMLPGAIVLSFGLPLDVSEIPAGTPSSPKGNPTNSRK